MDNFINDGAFKYSTLKGYKSIMNLTKPYFKGLLVTEITKAHIKRFRDTLVKNGLSNKTINHRVGLLSGIFRYAIDSRLTTENPANNLFLKVKKTEILPFTPKEVVQILNDMDIYCPHMTLFFAMGFFAGPRTGEILAIDKSDIDYNDHKIAITKTITANKFKGSTKTDEDRFIDITASLDRHIDKHFALMKKQTGNPKQYLFVNQYGERIISYATIVKYYWKPTLERLCIKYRRPIQMRHTFACQNIAAGSDLNWIKDMLGHETLEMLLRTYGKWLVKREGRAGDKFEQYLAEQQEKQDKNKEVIVGE